MELSLSFACNRYQWLEPLIDGEVEPNGIDLTVLTGIHSSERHERTIRGEFDVAEFSIGTYLTGWPDWEFASLPAFPRRFTPHSRTLVNTDAEIDSPADLEGKRVGIISWQNTLALWAKGVFADRYDLDLTTVDWCVTQPEPVPVDLPVPVQRIDREESTSMLAAGDLDALVLPSTVELYPPEEGTEPLFTDLRTVETAYHEETGFYPVMHNVVVADHVLADHPWVATELQTAFRRSVEAFEERARHAERQPLVWWQDYRTRERETFGDIWGRSFEFERNESELETVVGYAAEQGLLDAPVDAAELFAR